MVSSSISYKVIKSTLSNFKNVNQLGIPGGLVVRTLASIAGALGSIPDQELKKNLFKNVKLVNYSIKNGRGKLIHIN